MSKRSEMSKEFFESHSSVFFLVLLSLGSVALLVTGLLIPSDAGTAAAFFGTLSIQLSGSLLAAAIATLFLGLADVREYMAHTLARLITRGDIVHALSVDAKSRLERALALDNVGETTIYLEPSLYAALSELRNRSLSDFHLFNHGIDVTLRPHPEHPQLLVRESVRSFQVRSFHRREDKRRFPFKAYVEITLPSNVEVDQDDFVHHFEARAGEEFFDQSEIRVQKDQSGTLAVLSFEFKKELAVDNQLDIRISYSTLSSIEDHTELFICRYPTHGFRGSLRFLPGYRYDCAWFKSWDTGVGFIAGRSRQQVLGNGITAETHGWVLPGEGVFYSWQPSAYGA